MASRTYPGWLVGILIVVAAGGWVSAWNMGKATGAESVRSDSGRVSKGGSRSREERPVSPATFIPDGETARLLSSFEAIHAAEVPGKVNEKLIRACHQALLDGNLQRRARNYSLLLQLMRPEDGPALHEQFLELHREGKTFDEYKLMAVRWGEVDAPGAIKYLSSQVPLVFPGDDFRAIARGWAQADPKAALAWVDANPEMAKEMNAKTTVMEGWMREDPAAALKWIDQNMASMQPREYLDTMRIALGGQINGADTGVEDAVAWLTSRPKTEISNRASAMAWESIQWGMGEMPYEKAAAVWAKVGGQEWMEFRQFAGFSRAISHSRVADQGMEGFLGALEKTWPTEQVTSQFNRWTVMDPKGTLDWLSKAPPSSVTRAAIQGAVEALKETDPDAAAEWAAKLNGP